MVSWQLLKAHVLCWEQGFMSNDDDAPSFPESTERQWRSYLKNFNENIFPVFKPYGFTFAEAFAAWQTNLLRNAIDALLDQGRDNYEGNN